MVERDLPWVLYIEQEAPFLNWTRQNFLTILQSNDAVSLVAESRQQLVGFMIFSIQRRTEEGDSRTLKYLTSTTQPQLTIPPTQPTCFNLRHIAVAEKWQRRGVARTLLRHLYQRLRHAEDRIEARVPETRLSAQLLLKDSGYKAIKVLRGYFTDEDAFLIERRRDP
jgi:ribosomal protein S18 acetylase RimI-like enzyme